MLPAVEEPHGAGCSKQARRVVAHALVRLYNDLGDSLGPVQQQTLMLQRLTAVSRALVGAQGEDEEWREQLLLSYELLRCAVRLNDSAGIRAAFNELLTDAAATQ